MPSQTKHVLQDAATQLRRAARQLDALADNILHDVAPQGSIDYALRTAEHNINAALVRMAAFKS